MKEEPEEESYLIPDIAVNIFMAVFITVISILFIMWRLHTNFFLSLVIFVNAEGAMCLAGFIAAKTEYLYSINFELLGKMRQINVHRPVLGRDCAELRLYGIEHMIGKHKFITWIYGAGPQCWTNVQTHFVRFDNIERNVSCKSKRQYRKDVRDANKMDI